MNDRPEFTYVASQKALAAALDLSGAYVSRLKSEGRISPEADGSWCVEVVRKQIAQTADVGQSIAAESRTQARSLAGAQGSPDGRDSGAGDLPSVDGDIDFESFYGPDHAANFKIARSFREREQAAQARIDRMKAEDLLVEKADVERSAYTEARVIRDALMGLPTKIAPLLAPVTDAFELERMLRDSLRQVLADCVRAPVSEAGH